MKTTICDLCGATAYIGNGKFVADIKTNNNEVDVDERDINTCLRCSKIINGILEHAEKLNKELSNKNPTENSGKIVAEVKDYLFKSTDLPTDKAQVVRDLGKIIDDWQQA